METNKNASDEAEKVSRSGRFQGIQLVIVQSTVCIITVLLVVALKFIGGNAYTRLQSLYREAMVDHHVLESVLASAETAEEDSNTVLPCESTAVETSVTPIYFPPLLNGIVTSPFGNRADPFDNSLSDIHHGVDIAANEGTELAALCSGTVTEVGYQEAGYGHYVMVDCENGYEYLYAHCFEILVKEGEKISGGQIVALVGNTGRSTGSHVHIEWRVNGETTDPMTVLPKETYV